ncbi:MAG: NlpC/P60 family protein [Pseudomonadota bacterium]
MAEYHVQIARDWLGTPYVHQASAKGVGCDCLGLIRGVWREALGTEPVAAPAYTADWNECSGDEVLWAAATRHLEPRAKDFTRCGDVLLFRMRASGVAKHLGILSQGPHGPQMVHALSGCFVTEIPLTRDWQRRCVAQFSFPTGGN